MTPIKLNEYLNHPAKIHRSKAVIDLREINMVHAAPVENDHALLTLRYDPRTGALVPQDPKTVN